MPDSNSDTTTKACPFCGSEPVWLAKSNAYGTGASGMEPPSRALGCAMPLCLVQPKTAWLDTQEYVWGEGYRSVNHDAEALSAWNHRSAENV